MSTEPQPGTGLLHVFPSGELTDLDPFVFLDTAEPMHLGTQSIFVAPHPHRGFQPVGVVFRGRVAHRDSLGNELTVESGGIQWLVAGSGVIHEEILHGDEDGIFHMAQVWVNLPASEKMQEPSHHAVPASEVPTLSDLGEGSEMRLYAGNVDGSIGPAPLPVPVLIGHLALEPGGEATIPVPEGWTAATTVVDGKASVGDAVDLVPGDTVVFADDGESIHLVSSAGGQVLVMAGEPIGEPIAMGGSFVMNSDQEIQRAYLDYQSGLMGSLEPSR